MPLDPEDSRIARDAIGFLAVGVAVYILVGHLAHAVPIRFLGAIPHPEAHPPAAWYLVIGVIGAVLVLCSGGRILVYLLTIVIAVLMGEGVSRMTAMPAALHYILFGVAISYFLQSLAPPRSDAPPPRHDLYRWRR